MWQPILTAAELPALTARERIELDFKAQHVADPYELAKDVAAFANASGGTLLIGAAGRDRLEHWRQLSADDAARCRRGYEEAVRDRCRPAPIFSIEELPQADGFVVAVNVWPFPGQLVGVRLLKPEAPRCEGAVCFPLRVGTHTTFVTPEQIPMFVDAKLRRLAITLEAAVDKRVHITPLKEPDRHFFALLDRVDLLSNTLHFGRFAVEQQFTVPLDMVESASRTGSAVRIFIRGIVLDYEWAPDAPAELRAERKLFTPQL